MTCLHSLQKTLLTWNFTLLLKLVYYILKHGIKQLLNYSNLNMKQLNAKQHELYRGMNGK